MLHAQFLAEWTKGRWTQRPQRSICGVHFDSRSLRPGNLFVALKTEQNDGHKYLAQALAKGASAALVEKEDKSVDLPQLCVQDSLSAFQTLAKYHRQAFKGEAIGITGSFGKTSTKDALALLLSPQATLKTEGNFNNTLGLPYTLLHLDTQQHRYAVVEAGINKPQEMDVLADILRPDAAIVTNIFGQHLEGLKTIENVALEKSKLLDTLKPGGLFLTTPSAMAFDCFRKRQEAIIVCPKGSFQDKARDVRSYEERIDLQNNCIYVQLEGYAQWRFPLVSPGILQNLMLASTLALELGLSAEHIQERILHWQPSPERGQWLRTPHQLYYVDCYNSGPVALLDALGHFRRRLSSPKGCLYVLGAMNELGERSEAVHYDLGKSFDFEQEDQFLLIGEPARALKQGLLDQGVPATCIQYLETTEEGHELVRNFQGPIFLKGSHAYRLKSLLPDSGFVSNN